MTCQKDECECVESLMMRMLCPDWRDPERKRDEHDGAQCLNFAKLSIDQQVRCICYLRVKAPAAILAEWTDQVARDVSIGSTDIRFHLGVGMAIRNTLREVVPDKDLPGEGEQNWDDFYRGALYALIVADSLLNYVFDGTRDV